MSEETSERDVHVRVRGLSFATERGVVLDRVNMDIPRGGVTAILGPSGTGKSALLRLIAARLAPRAGRVDVDGRDVHRLDRPGLEALRRRTGMLFEAPALLDGLDVFDNVALPLREHTRLPQPLIRQLVLLHLETVGLRAARRLMPGELSHGMARRVALARALVLDPSLMLYDEPFSGEDPISIGALGRAIRSINDTLAPTGIVVSRDVARGLTVADYAYVLADGDVIGRGTPEELRASRSPAIRQLIKARPDGPVPFHYPGPSFAEELLGRDAAEAPLDV